MTAHRALFLSWCPPDLLRPRAIQVGRIAKALASRGWQIDLVCASLDLRLEDDTVDVELGDLYAPYFERIDRVPDADFGMQPKAKGFSERLTALMAGRWSGRPPRAWSEGAADMTLRRMRRGNIPVLMSFGQPWGSHMAALLVKRRRPDIYWTAHFSDPWTDNPYLGLEGEALEAARADERAVVETADSLVFVTSQTADLVMAKYPSSWRSKVNAIPHLLDEDVLGHMKPMPRTDQRFRLVHAGSLYDGRRAPVGLFEGLQRLRGNGVLPDKLEIRFVGDMPPSLAKEIADRGIAEYVSWTTPLYYLPSLGEMAAADALLVIDAAFETSPFLPSKLVDYLMFDRPIVGLTNDNSATRALLADLGYPSADPSDADAAAALLQDLLANRAGRAPDITASHRSERANYGLSQGGGRYETLLRQSRGGSLAE